MANLVRVCNNLGIRHSLQLGHAGRKASASPPHKGGKPLSEGEEPWETIAPSDIPFGNEWPRPLSMTRDIMEEVIRAHIEAVQRCERMGFDAIELHGAHGYLVSSFLSPIATAAKTSMGAILLIGCAIH